MDSKAKRSACDRCRAKRVRCLRAENSRAPCARCVHIGAECITGSAGLPGRPRKTHLARSSTHRPLAATSPGTAASPQYWPTPRETDGVGQSASPANEQATSADWFGAEDSSLDLFGLDLPKSQDDNWTISDGSNLFYQSSPSNSAQALQPSVSPLLPGLAPSDNFDLMCTGHQQQPSLDPDYFFFDSPERLSNTTNSKGLDTARALLRFREKLELNVTSMCSFLSDPRAVMEDCRERSSTGLDGHNPVASVLMCTKEFIGIVQTLTRPAPSSQQLITNSVASSDLTTETSLLILANYLALMGLYDTLFQNVYRCLSQVPAEVVKAMKVKAVFRIGGISSLQDISGKAYATGIIEVIQGHIRALEECMGLPPAYRLANDENENSSLQANGGAFSDGDRALLLHAVMAQKDVKSQRANKSYAELIRENIKNSVAVFDRE